MLVLEAVYLDWMILDSILQMPTRFIISSGRRGNLDSSALGA